MTLPEGVTQIKFWTKTRSVHGKFNCVTVKFNGTQHGIQIISEIHLKFNLIHISFTRNACRNTQFTRIFLIQDSFTCTFICN